MSKKDYTKFSRTVNEEHNVIDDMSIPEVIYPLPEDDIVEEIVDTPKTIEQKPIVFGKVTGCAKLNVRQESNLQSDILCCLFKNDEIEIDEDKSTEEFYAICTPAGLEGYCLKKFIEIRK